MGQNSTTLHNIIDEIVERNTYKFNIRYVILNTPISYGEELFMDRLPRRNFWVKAYLTGDVELFNEFTKTDDGPSFNIKIAEVCFTPMCKLPYPLSLSDIPVLGLVLNENYFRTHKEYTELYDILPDHIRSQLRGLNYELLIGLKYLTYKKFYKLNDKLGLTPGGKIYGQAIDTEKLKQYYESIGFIRGKWNMYQTISELLKTHEEKALPSREINDRLIVLHDDDEKIDEMFLHSQSTRASS